MTVQYRRWAVVLASGMAVLMVCAQVGFGAGKRRARRTPYRPVPLEQTGTIEVDVVFEGAIPEAKKLAVTAKGSVCTHEAAFDETWVISSDRKVQHAVVGLAGITEGKPFPKDAKYTLDQRGCVFVPHVVVVPLRKDLTILNSDGIMHNVHTRSMLNRELNKAMPGRTKQMVVSFRRAERFLVQCDVHKWMAAWIVVARNPYYAATDKKGQVRLEDVPVGTHTITLWHEAAGLQEQQVTVKKDEVTKVRLVLRAKK